MTPELKSSIESSVLCWLATASREGQPNVSPKEIFTFYNEYIIVANIASPNTVRNIKSNPQVSISFIDILVQKGFQVTGKAQIIDSKNEDYQEMEELLLTMTQGKFPFQTITKIEILHTKPIIAPRYLLYPETTEQDQIANAKRAYGLS